MGYAIELNFDKGSSNKFKKLWTALKYHNICDFMADNGVEPHIALLVLNDEADKAEAHITKVVSDFFEEIPSFELDVNSIGLFPTEANIVYLSLVVTAHLADLQLGLYNRICEEGYGDYVLDKYKANNWIPHITMTMNIKETDMIDAIKLLKRKFSPTRVSVASVAFLKFYPVEYKANIELKS